MDGFSQLKYAVKLKHCFGVNQYEFALNLIYHINKDALSLHKHYFHKNCALSMLLNGGKCCVCGLFYSLCEGDQPKNGVMVINHYDENNKMNLM